MLILPQHIAHIFTVLPKLTSTEKHGWIFLFVVTHEMKGGRGFHDAFVLCLEAIEGWLE